MAFSTRQDKKTPHAALLSQSLWLLGFDGDPGASAFSDLPAFIRHHGIASVLDANRLAQIPGPTLDTLKSEQLRVAMRALHLSATLTRVSTCFRSHGVRHAAIKGPALAQLVYGRVDARAGLDIDILIPIESWSRAIEALTAMEFRSQGDPRTVLARGTHELVFDHDTLTRLELHQRLLRRRYALPSDWGADQLSYVDLHGVSVPTLSPTFALPYLAGHANQHQFRRLIWLMDILTLLRHRAFDAEQAAWLSRRADLGGAVDVGMTLLQHLFEAEVPAPLQRLQRRSWARKALVEHAIAAINDCSSDRDIARNIGRARRVAIDIGLQQTLRGRVRALGDWLSPTERDQAWLALPPPIRMFYPAIRLARLLVQRR